MPTMPIDALWQPSNFSVTSGSGSSLLIEKTGGEADVGKYLPNFKAGQWWAQKKPACLLRVREAPKDGNLGTTVSLDMWPPGQHQELLIYFDGPALPFVFLWYVREVPWPIVADDPEWSVGASHVCLRNERIFFIGPRSGSGFTVHAAWEVNDADLCNRVTFQPGSLVEPPPQTAFEQLNTDIDR